MPTDPLTAVLLPGFGPAVPAGPAPGGCADEAPCGGGCGGGCGCGGSCGCGGGTTSGVAVSVPRAGGADSPWAPVPAPGGYGDPALDLVAAALDRARRLALAPLEAAEACPAPAGVACRVYLGDLTRPRDLAVQLAPPPSGPADPVPLWTYHSADATTTAFDWTGFALAYRRSVAATGGGTGANLTPGTRLGAAYAYSGKDGAGNLAPPPEAANALKQEADNSWTETAPDGTKFRYAAATGRLAAVVGPSGGRWTLAYGASGLVSAVADPTGRRTTISYGASRPTRVTDPGGRRTTFTADAATGTLLQRVATPDGNLTTLVCHFPK
jgi:YD repeat-containing protein